MSSIFTAEGSRFVKLHENWMDHLARGSGTITFIMAVLTLIDVIGRATGIGTIHGCYELCQYLLVWLCFIGCSYAHARGGNIRVEILTQRFGPKARDILLIVSLLVGLFVFGNIFYANITFTYESIIQKEGMIGVTALPVWPVKIAIPFGCFFLCIQFILEIGRTVGHLRRGGG